MHYGWVIVAVLSLTVTVSYGVLMYAFPVVLAAMQAELGVSQPLLLGAYSLGALVTGVVAIPVGRSIDRRGPRPVMTLSAVVASGLVVAWSQAATPAHVYLVWIGLGACAAGLFYEPAFTTITRWFGAGRARALATVTIAGGLASTIFVPLTAWLSESFGWRDAVLWLAVLLAVVTILPHAALLRDRAPGRTLHDDGAPSPAMSAADVRPAQASSVRDVFRSATLRRFTLAFVLAALASMAFVVHLIPILLERGLTLSAASLALATLGVTKLTGRVLFVPLVSRAGIVNATSFVLVLQALGLLALFASSSLVGIALCVLLVGVGEGASTPARAELLAVFQSAAGYGAVAGVVALFLAGARAMGPVALSLVYGVSGGYDVPLLALVMLFLLAGAVLWRL